MSMLIRLGLLLIVLGGVWEMHGDTLRQAAISLMQNPTREFGLWAVAVSLALAVGGGMYWFVWLKYARNAITSTPLPHIVDHTHDE